MHSLATISLGFLLAASIFSVGRGAVAMVNKRWRGALAVLIGLVLFAAYVTLLGVAAYVLGASDVGGAAIDAQGKARVLAESTSMLMITCLIGVPLGVLGAALTFIRSRRRSKTAE